MVKEYFQKHYADCDLILLPFLLSVFATDSCLENDIQTYNLCSALYFVGHASCLPLFFLIFYFFFSFCLVRLLVFLFIVSVLFPPLIFSTLSFFLSSFIYHPSLYSLILLSCFVSFCIPFILICFTLAFLSYSVTRI